LQSATDDGIVVLMEARAMAAAPRLSTEEYLDTPETLTPTELVYGAVRVADAPTVVHQQALGAFHLALALHVRERRLGTVLLSPLDVIFDYDRALILQPDLVYISNARRHILRRDRVIGPPDLVLEILSPNPRIGKLQERLHWFAQYGVREIWLLHQLDERLEIVCVQHGCPAPRTSLDYATPIASSVLAHFTGTVQDILRE
jgi:Uma2 family endonuclease